MRNVDPTESFHCHLTCIAPCTDRPIWPTCCRRPRPRTPPTTSTFLLLSIPSIQLPSQPKHPISPFRDHPKSLRPRLVSRLGPRRRRRELRSVHASPTHAATYPGQSPFTPDTSRRSSTSTSFGPCHTIAAKPSPTTLPSRVAISIPNPTRAHHLLPQPRPLLHVPDELSATPPHPTDLHRVHVVPGDRPECYNQQPQQRVRLLVDGQLERRV